VWSPGMDTSYETPPRASSGGRGEWRPPPPRQLRGELSLAGTEGTALGCLSNFMAYTARQDPSSKSCLCAVEIVKKLSVCSRDRQAGAVVLT
jgi:hypothetical protein